MCVQREAPQWSKGFFFLCAADSVGPHWSRTAKVKMKSFSDVVRSPLLSAPRERESPPQRSVFVFVETAFPTKSPSWTWTVPPCPGLIKSKHCCRSLQRSFTQLPMALSICWIKSSAYPPSARKAINSIRQICCTTIYIQFEVWGKHDLLLEAISGQGYKRRADCKPSLLKPGPV